MSKRFTESDKWKNQWFINLPNKYKLFWIYILDDCNHAGVWRVNIELASFIIKEELTLSDSLSLFSEKIKVKR